ncbi:MAG: hypothetical protein JSS07_07900 [Proteobacteria bacterium]|nr:hypothetical protein [Pseudomonadota bacterium]
MFKKSTCLFKVLFLVITLIPAIGMAGSIGDAAENLLGPTSLVTKLVEIGCYVVGLAFVMMSFTQYKIHRQSPKLVPLATPITLLILGLIALLIPYGTKLAETGKSEIKKEERQALPLPGESPKGPSLPYPTSQQQEQQNTQQPEPSSPQPGSSGGGGWTTDPRYRQ